MTEFGLGIRYTKIYKVHTDFASMNFKVRGRQKHKQQINIVAGKCSTNILTIE